MWPWDIVNWSLRYWRMGRILGNNAGGGPRGGKGCEGAVIGVFFLLPKTMWKRAYCENAAHRNLVPLWSASCHLTGGQCAGRGSWVRGQGRGGQSGSG